MDLGQRRYVCDACGMLMDRDLNAAINLEQCWLRLELPRVPREVTPVERV